MSVAGQVIAQVRELIGEASAALSRKDTEQDGRMDEIERRLDALEEPAPAARARTAPTAVKAKAGTAKGTGSAPST